MKPGTSPGATLHLLTPTYRPAGGVVKVMDYALHARSLGYRTSVWSPEKVDLDSELFTIERLRELADGQTDFHRRRRLDVGPEDLVLVSLPDHYEVALRSLPRGATPARIIHLVQGTRHTNPAWDSGYPTRLLTRPASRIAINDIVADEIRPWLDPRGLLRTIGVGHDADYFAREREPGLGGRPLRVGYTTWKSTVGDRVATLLADDPRFEFRAVRETVSWDRLRDLYHWSEVFLGTPDVQEGFYLPGLEAMAARCLVVIPDAGGNLAYCRPGENCVLVPWEDERAYVAALTGLLDWDDDRVELVRAAGRGVVPRFGLDAERAGFADFLDEVWARVRTAEGAGDAPSRPEPGRVMEH